MDVRDKQSHKKRRKKNSFDEGNKEDGRGEEQRQVKRKRSSSDEESKEDESNREEGEPRKKKSRFEEKKEKEDALLRSVRVFIKDINGKSIHLHNNKSELKIKYDAKEEILLVNRLKKEGDISPNDSHYLLLFDGFESSSVNSISKVDADFAGTKHSEKCSLIITEGVSARSLAISGLNGLHDQQRYYGILPFKGKIPNVQGKSIESIIKNVEIQTLIKTLGLTNNHFKGRSSMRYGKVIIMADRDYDGSHFKGLIMNLFYVLWPGLLKCDNFLYDFVTPILKASKDSNIHKYFDSIQEYDMWREDDIDSSNYTYPPKYFKGLSTSSTKEGIKYFKEMNTRLKVFEWKDKQDSGALDLAFRPNNGEERRKWILNFKPGTYLDPRAKTMRYFEFVEKELVLYAKESLHRSIPSLLDGFKPSQRKTMYTMLMTKELEEEINVEDLAGVVSRHCGYNHGNNVLCETMIKMAQGFAGKNNITFLLPSGQFGTRDMGGDDHGGARYLHTMLNPKSRLFFTRDDDEIIPLSMEDGKPQPKWYIPVIPIILANGCIGVGTGWRSDIPQYDPLQIISNIRLCLEGQPMKPMIPWHKCFNGTVEEHTNKKKEKGFLVKGSYEYKEIDNILVISEIPFSIHTRDYRTFLESKVELIEKIDEVRGGNKINFTIHLKKGVDLPKNMAKEFKLESFFTTKNMHLFTTEGVLKKYNSAEEVIKDFVDVRKNYYLKRLNYLKQKCYRTQQILKNKIRFLDDEKQKWIKDAMEMEIYLKQEGYERILSDSRWRVEINKSLEKECINKEKTEAEEEEEKGFQYLLELQFRTPPTLSLQSENEENEKQINKLENLTEIDLWLQDLQSLEDSYTKKRKQNRRNKKRKRKTKKKKKTKPKGLISV